MPPAVSDKGWAVDVVLPHYGRLGDVTLVHLIGRFPETSYVWFGAQAATVLAHSQDSLYVLAPPGIEPGAVDITLRRTGTGVVLTVPAGYTYTTDALASTGSGATGSSATGSGATGSGSGATGSAATGSAGSGAAGGNTPTPEPTSVPEPSADPGPVSRRQRRVSVADAVTDLGNGLRGARVVAGDPTVGAGTCVNDLCRLT
jgi:hypothetical protein